MCIMVAESIFALRIASDKLGHISIKQIHIVAEIQFAVNFNLLCDCEWIKLYISSDSKNKAILYPAIFLTPCTSIDERIHFIHNFSNLMLQKDVNRHA